MKKRLLSCLLLVVLLVSAFGCHTVLAEDDVSDVYTCGENWREEGCVPSMLNFGYTQLSFGESLFDANKNGKCNNFKKSTTVSQVEHLLDDGKSFYIYAKFGGKNISYLYIDANLVITSPKNQYYLVNQNWTIEDCKGNYTFSWFFDVTEKLNEIKSDNGGSLPRGTYGFTMIFNGYTFRTTSIQIN